jgi:hypothetical protein
MRLSTLLRRDQQSGQMLVSVIVLLTLMFFIGSAMALAVSSSLHTIAQTNSMDSVAYAAESATARGVAANRIATAPVVNTQGAGGATKWSYSYEVVFKNGTTETLGGRSAEAFDTGSAVLTDTDFEAIKIPLTLGADHFEIYRTTAGTTPSTTGYIGDAAGPGPIEFDDKALEVTKPAYARCTGSTLAPLPKTTNNYPLAASTCRVPVGSPPSMWSGPAQSLPSKSCASQPLIDDVTKKGYSPGDEPGTAWGVIGWHDVSSSKRAKKLYPYVSITTCEPTDPDADTGCSTATSSYGVFYFYCGLDGATGKTVEYKNLYIVNPGGDANISAFVVRAADSGSDCVYTTIGQAGLLTDETQWSLPGCGWTTAQQTLWNRVLP